MNINNMKKVSDIFSNESTYDTKHKLNTSTKIVPSELLDQIEAGCSLETLEKLANNEFDIFKYKTQITIHGIFPNTNTRSIGGRYVNLIQNKNKSVGIKYTAIDYSKKKRLFDMLNTLGLFNISENSTDYYIYKIKEIKDKSELSSISSEFYNFAKNINKNLFCGNVDCFLSKDIFGRIFVILTLHINCFYERNFSLIFENLSQMSYTDGCNKINEIKAENKRKYEESEKLWKQKANERIKNEAINKKQFITENPLDDFILCNDYIPKSGDIIASVKTNWDGNSYYWDFRKITKSFGRLIATPCDKYGNKLNKKGSEALKQYKNIYLKK